MARAQAIKYNKNRRDIDKMIRKYYQGLSQEVIADFEATYDKLLAGLQNGRQPTPADLYKLDKYWSMQTQLDQKLTRLGRRQIATLTRGFRRQFYDVYKVIKIDGLKTFSTIDDGAVEQLINQIWCADGKSWSTRIWDNIAQLKQTLNEGLIHTVVTGKKTSQLKKELQERFNVSYHRADALVRTELAHVQTQAAQQRYKDYGIQEYEFYADPDERTCEVCGKLHNKRFPIASAPKVPQHPNCRCAILPVIDIKTTAIQGLGEN
jgi:SPP1 gp7 family putative phage head morphogenesis protein